MVEFGFMAGAISGVEYFPRPLDLWMLKVFQLAEQFIDGFAVAGFNAMLIQQNLFGKVKNPRVFNFQMRDQRGFVGLQFALKIRRDFRPVEMANQTFAFRFKADVSPGGFADDFLCGGHIILELLDWYLKRVALVVVCFWVIFKMSSATSPLNQVQTV